jgi:regulator of cell morphogenesis and NO signaling
MNNINEQSIIGQIVASDYRTAAVFKKHGIDFCCNGDRTLEQACNQQNLNVTQVMEEIRQACSSNTSSMDYNSWPLDLLTDYIEKTHHRYVESKSIELKSYLSKIVQVHGAKHPELLRIQTIFNESAGDLAMHMKREELVLFPFIRKMIKSQQQQAPIEPIHFGTVENPIAMMKHDHDLEGERFREIAKLSNNYTPPEDACNTYRVTFALLKEFEEDLHKHIHLENNILFPKAIEMEKEMRLIEEGS